MRYFGRQDAEDVERTGCKVITVDVDGVEYQAARVLSSFWLVLEPTNDAFTPHMLRGEGWEAWNTVWVSQNIYPGHVFIDAGANVGYYSLQAAMHGLNVVSYEPNANLVPLIKKSAEISGVSDRIHVIQAGLSDTEDVLRLGIPGKYTGSASFNIKDGEGVTIQECPVIPLDNHLDLYDGKIVDIIKVDVEGFEDHVWRGSKEFRNQHPETLFFMEHTNQARPLINEIESEGYVVTEVDDSGAEIPFDRNLEDGELTMIVARRSE